MMSRVFATFLAVLLVAPDARSAQTAAGVARVPPATVRRSARAPQPAERPTETRVPPPAENRDLFLATPDTYAPRYDRPSRHSVRQPRFLGSYGYGYVQDVYVPPPPMPVPPNVTGVGFLRLIVEPPVAQVYVDGYFVGTVEEFSGFLEPGSHRVELRAPGFHSNTFDVRIFANEAVTYRNTLMRSVGTPEPVRPRVSQPDPRALYVIPRCFAGDTPPTPAQLPAGCEMANLRRIPHP